MVDFASMAVTILSPTTSVTDNGDGTFTAAVSAGQLWYKDDNDAWANVTSGDKDNLAGNCQMVLIAGGFRLWSPNGKPPYNPDWLPTDYWVDVKDASGFVTFTPLRSQVDCSWLIGKTPSLSDSCNDNLTRSEKDGVVYWKNAADENIFILTKEETDKREGVSRVALRFA